MPHLILRAVVINITRGLARRLLMVGLGLGVLGGLVLAWGSVHILRAMRSKNGAQRPNRVREKASTLAGFGLIAAGLFLQMLSRLARSFGH